MNQKMLEDICGSDLFDTIIRILTIDIFATDGAYGKVFSRVQDMYEAVQSVAVVLIFIYFMIAFVDKLSGESFTFEQMFRQIILLLVAKFLIDHGMEIIQLLYDFGTALLVEVAAPIPEGGGAMGADNAKELLKEFESSLGLKGFMKVLKDVIVWLWLFIPWIFSWVLGICVKIIMYSRMIEIYVRAVFAPIAFADFYQGGLQSAGFRYLRNFLAVAIQGALILSVAAVYSGLFSTVVASAGLNFLNFLGLYLAFLSAAVMLMFRSLTLAKEIVGTA